MRRSRRILFGIVLTLLCGVAAAIYLGRTHQADDIPDAPLRGYEAQTGSRYLPLPRNPFQAPTVRELDVPSFADATSVWGATGRDDNGGMWLGVSAAHSGMSAHLMLYAADTDSWQDCGTVVDQLAAAGLRRQDEGQVKIHSKIIAANDGWLYFTSMDEDGEDASANVPPRWGGHLWRIDPRTKQWQHLIAAAEGLIAAAGVGRYVYALGYWGHVLYQYDTLTGATKRVVVGSAPGHISRNFLADVRGHAYVPRLITQPNGKVLAKLVEYDVNLQEVAATPLDYYLGSESPAANHGIVGVAYLADGRLVFTTHRGHVYAIDPALSGSASVKAVGWFHPAGEAYAASLFTFNGKSVLAGVTQRAGRYEWVVFDLATAISFAFPLDTRGLRNVLLYGSVSRDNVGRFYVGGWARGPTGGQRPLVLQITAAP